MRKSLPPIVAALTVAMLVPNLAEGARHKHRQCSIGYTNLTAPVEATGNTPVNGTETRGGIVDGEVCGKPLHGADRVVITFTASGTRTVATTVFGPLGSFSTSGQVTGVKQPDGSIAISGTGTITGGTGVYKGATGSFSATGTKAANSSVNTIHVTGTISF